MFTPPGAARAVAGRLLQHLINGARAHGLQRLSLETGAGNFCPRRALYERHGFCPCPPFEGYWNDPNSCFYSLTL